MSGDIPFEKTNEGQLIAELEAKVERLEKRLAQALALLSDSTHPDFEAHENSAWMAAYYKWLKPEGEAE